MKHLASDFFSRKSILTSLSNLFRRCGAWPAGHYYSPIPSQEDVLSYFSSRSQLEAEIPGVDMNTESQVDLLNQFIRYYDELPFADEHTPECRYYYNNRWFSYSDAIFLYCFLREHQPGRIIEVGSGFSSAVMLDTVEQFFPVWPEITFIDPHPDRIMDICTHDDQVRVRVLDEKAQKVSRDVFLALESGDLLFIDSSHVVKCGSDLQFVLFEILPNLQPGVFVHFHDVKYPFDYPKEWIMTGRYWNEAYFLRAFLSYNSEWSIRFFTTYMHFICGDLLHEKMPLCCQNPGGSLYIQRVAGD